MIQAMDNTLLTITIILGISMVGFAVLSVIEKIKRK